MAQFQYNDGGGSRYFRAKGEINEYMNSFNFE